MFLKSTLALAIIFGLASASLAATKQQRLDGAPAATWQDPTLPMKTWDSYGKRWD